MSKCVGCGAHLQSNAKDSIGYTNNLNNDLFNTDYNDYQEEQAEFISQENMDNNIVFQNILPYFLLFLAN